MQCASPGSIFDCRSRPRIHAHCIWGSQDERETIVASRVDALRVAASDGTHGQPESRKRVESASRSRMLFAPFGVAYEKIGTIQRRLAWPLHKDDTLSRSGRPTGLNIYFSSTFEYHYFPKASRNGLIRSDHLPVAGMNSVSAFSLQRLTAGMLHVNTERSPCNTVT